MYPQKSQQPAPVPAQSPQPAPQPAPQSSPQPALQQNYGPAPMKGGIKTMTIVLYAIGVLMVIFIILAVLLSQNTTNSDISKLSAQQTEIARVAEIGVNDDSASLATKNIATTIRSASLSAIAQLRGVSGGADVSSSLIAEFSDSSADSLLETSKKTNEFNDTFLRIVSLQLANALTSIESIDTSGLDGDESLIIEDLLESYALLVESIDS